MHRTKLEPNRGKSKGTSIAKQHKNKFAILLGWLREPNVESVENAVLQTFRGI